MSTLSQFKNALASVNSGEAIIVSDGTKSGWNATIPARASGTDEKNRVYILSESLYGASLTGYNQWTIQASYITIAGFEKVMDSGNAYKIEGDSIRIACNKILGGTTALILSLHGNPEFYDDLELDNNIFTGAKGLVYRFTQCKDFSEACVGTSKRLHMHHNRISSDSPNEHFLYYGLGYSPQDEDDPWNDPKNRSDNVFENNLVQWPGTDPIDVKSSRNIFRNNCFINTRPISIRTGNDNLVTGNWFKNAAGTNWKSPGWGNYYVFNYFEGNDTARAFSFRTGQDNLNEDHWGYFSTSEGVYSNNVFNKYRWLVSVTNLHLPLSTYPRLTEPHHKPRPQSNKIQNNILHSNNYASDFLAPSDGHTNASTFARDNPGYNNNIVDSNVLTGSPECGTPGINGIGNSVPGSPKLLGSPESISAPSWWN